MQNFALQSRIMTSISWGALVITLLVTDRISSEPVNVGKMVALSTLAFMLLGLSFGGILPMLRENVAISAGFLIFLTAVFYSAVLSENKFERGFYGTLGRNTGFLTYFSLVVVFLTILNISDKRLLIKPIKYFHIAFMLNIAYCILVSFGLDIFTWSNQYNLVLGTFGNPNFVGAFVGIGIVLIAVGITSHEVSRKLKFIGFLTLFPSTFVLYKSDALQGSLLVSLGILLICFYVIHEKSIDARLKFAFNIGVSLVLLNGATGVFGIGPLANFLNKPSIQFRGEYWFAGIQMGLSNLFRGVGIDSYGTYYRTYRGSKSVITPGVDVTTDAAHNVFIDILAGTGIIGFSAYLFINLYLLLISIKHLKTNSTLSFYFKFFFTGWLLYQIQSLVSINQIGLAVWGWIFGGSLLLTIKLSQSNSDSRASGADDKIGRLRIGKSKKNQELIPAQILLSTIILGVIGFAISSPPFFRDMEMRKATVARSVSDVAEVSRKWPTDASRITRSIIALANSGNLDEAKALVQIVNRDYPNDYLGWYSALQIAKSEGLDTTRLRKILNKIDPLNSAYKL